MTVDPDTRVTVEKALKHLMLAMCQHQIVYVSDTITGEWTYHPDTESYFTASHLRLLAEILDEKNASPG